MKNFLKSACILACLSSLAALQSCGKNPVNGEKSSPSPAPLNAETYTENVDPEKAYSGTLYLIPNGRLKDGFVNYTLNADGLIVYEGYVTYSFCDYCSWTETVGFSSRYKADPKSLLSETYKTVGNTHSDFKLKMTVTEEKDGFNIVDVGVREDYDTHGRFEVKTDRKFIDIQYAEITGRVAYSDIAIHLHK